MFSIIEQIIANHFGIKHEELLTNSTRTASDARHFLWYILHSVLGYSSNALGKRYGVSPRNIFLYSSVVRDGIKNQPFYATNFKSLQVKLKMLDLI